MGLRTKTALFGLLLSTLFSFTVNAQTQNSKPKLNQLGFYPEAPKLAITPEANASSFHIREATSGRVVYQGTLTSDNFYELSDETVKIADFSDFNPQDGSYQLIIDGGSISYPFEIKNNLFSELSDGLIKALYFNRASVELPEEYAGKWNRPAGHPDTDIIIHSSAASEGRPAGSTISSPGGWYDAGDFNKYVVPISSSISHMLSAYEHFPDYFTSRNLNIPESGDNVPDILDEALFALEWLLTMQDPADGGVYNKLTHANFQATVMPHQASAARYVVQKGTAAALDFAAVMAQASRIFEPFYPDFADTALSAAENAWAWAEANPDMEYNQGAMNNQFDPDIGTGGYGDNNFDDEWFWAASELYISTGDESYYENDGWVNTEIFGWNSVRALGLFSLVHNRKDLTSIGLADTSAMKSALVSAFDWYVDSGNNSPYRSAFGIQSWQFGWGSNGTAGGLGMAFSILYQTTGDIKYYDAAIHIADYLLGRNAVGYSYVTGFGDQAPMNIHHRQSEADNIIEPTPGWVAGGANPYNQTQDCGANAYNSTLAALSYLDDYCSYSTNEITTYWNSPFIYTVAALEHLTPNPIIENFDYIIVNGIEQDSLYETGSEITIKWQAELTDNVDLLYKRYLDEEFTLLAENIPVDQNTSMGEYSGFTIPNLPGDSLLFRVRESDNHDDWGQSPLLKIKPVPSISSLTIETSTTFEPDKRVTIKWDVFDVDNLDIFYRLTSQEEYTLVDSGVDAENGIYRLFKVPDAAGDSFIIRLQDSNNDTIFIESEPIEIIGTTSNEDDPDKPTGYLLRQNYPNPFNPATNINFELPEAGLVRLTVYDSTSRVVAELVNKNMPSGDHTVQFDASSISSGIYFYQLSTSHFTQTKKMILIK